MLTTDEAPVDCPVVCSSVIGYSPLGGELGRWPAEPKARATRAAGALTGRKDGLLLLLLRLEGAPRPLALVQAQGGPFYRGSHPDRRRATIWRDYYYAVGYQLPIEIDRMWGCDAFLLQHPTDHGWPPELAAALADGFGHMADDHAVGVTTIHVGGCCLTAGVNPFIAGAQRLEGEEQAPSRSLTVEELPVDGLADWTVADEIRLVRVGLGQAHERGETR